MALHTHKRLRRPGLPEVVALGVVVLAAAAATMWWRGAGDSSRLKTQGRILACDIRSTHYNAQTDQTKVIMTYRYEVMGQTFTGRFQGSWPDVEGPNALPQDRLAELQDPNFPLVVLYDPRSPDASKLDFVEQDAQFLLGVLAIATLGIAALYFTRIYPAWRAR